MESPQGGSHILNHTLLEEGVEDQVLCDICKRICRDDFRNGKLYRHISVTELSESAETCAFCSLISRAICRAAHDPESPPPSLIEALSFTISKDDQLDPSRFILLEYAPIVNYVYIRLESGDQGTKNYRSGPKIGQLYFYEILETTPSDDKKAITLPYHYHLSPRTDDEAVFTQIFTWLSECVTKHGRGCKDSAQGNYVPTRLLYIEKQGTMIRGVQLVETNEVNFNQFSISLPGYMALSHRWGIAHVLSTKEDNIQSHYAGIPMADLPKTFQDAVFVCSTIGLSFIWIDSLCIVQDDNKDWEREAELMGDVYANAFCTISATAAEGSTDGFLKPRELTVPIRLDQSHPFFVTDGANVREDVNKSNLNSRGWVFQERYLSPRILHFTKSQVYWECEQGDDGFQEIGHSSGGRGWWWTSDTSLQYENPWLNDWKRFVQSYSLTHLTRETDRLVAIAGLVSHMIKQRPYMTFYYYGVWRDWTYNDLCWISLGSKSLRNPAGRWHAPSWSWASHNGPIAFMWAPDLKAMMRVLKYPESGLFSKGSTCQVPLLVQSRLCNLPQIESTLDGLPEMIMGSITFMPAKYRQTIELLQLITEDGKVIGWCSIDQGPQSIKGTKYFCSPIYFDSRDLSHQKKYENDTVIYLTGYYVLVLVESDRQSEFSRVGIGCIYETDWVDKFPLEAFTLI